LPASDEDGQFRALRFPDGHRPRPLEALYLKAAQGVQPNPFAEVKQIFSDFSTFGAP